MTEQGADWLDTLQPSALALVAPRLASRAPKRRRPIKPVSTGLALRVLTYWTAAAGPLCGGCAILRDDTRPARRARWPRPICADCGETIQ